MAFVEPGAGLDGSVVGGAESCGVGDVDGLFGIASGGGSFDQFAGRDGGLSSTYMLVSVGAMNRSSKVMAGLGVGVALTCATLYSVSADSSAPTKVVVTRASDGKVLQLGDVVSQLEYTYNSDGTKSCISTRAATEIRVEAPLDDNTAVEESTDKDCQVVITRIGPPLATPKGGTDKDSTQVTEG